MIHKLCTDKYFLRHCFVSTSKKPVCFTAYNEAFIELYYSLNYCSLSTAPPSEQDDTGPTNLNTTGSSATAASVTSSSLMSASVTSGNSRLLSFPADKMKMLFTSIGRTVALQNVGQAYKFIIRCMVTEPTVSRLKSMKSMILILISSSAGTIESILRICDCMSSVRLSVTLVDCETLGTNCTDN